MKSNVIASILIAAVIAVYSYSNFYIKNTSAAGNVLLTVSPSAARVSPGASFTVDILINANDNEIGSIDFRTAYFEFDPSFVQVDSANLGVEVDPILSSSGSINNITGKVTGIYGLPANSETYTFPTTGNFTFVTFNMTAKASVSGTSYLRIYPASNDIEIANLTFAPPYLDHTETNSSIIASDDVTAPSVVDSLVASNSTKSTIDLTWTAPGDDSGIGTASSYDLRYSTSTINDGNWTSATVVTGMPAPSVAGTTTETKTVTGLSSNTLYYFAIKSSDEVPNQSGISNITSGTTLINTIPVMTAVTITPDPAYKSTATLTANPSATDADLDTITYSYQWKKGGVDISGQTASTLSNTNFAKGDVITVTVTPYDGTDYGDPMTSAGLTISNSTPVMTEATITPNPAYKSTVTLTANPAATDEDTSDTITYSYQWKKGGLDIAGQTGSTLSSSNYIKGDVITVTVIPNDGTIDGNPMTSAGLTISNSAPVMSSATISPLPAYKSTSNLTAAGASTDADSDSVAYTYQWKKAGIDIGGATSSTLASSNYVKGDVITVSITPNDGTIDGTPMVSAGATISNSLPSQPTVAVAPSTAYDASELTCNPTGSTDADTDSITYTYAWQKDAVVQGALTTNTVSASSTSAGETWKCVATPNDGTADGTAGEGSVTILSDLDATPPTIPAANILGTTVQGGNDAITITFDEPVVAADGTWSANEFTSIESPNGTALVLTNAVFGYAGNILTITLNEATDNTYLGNANVIAITPALEKIEDASGNPLAITEIIGTTAITGDATGPTAALSYSPDQLVKSNDSVTITATFGESISETTVPTIAITTLGDGSTSATNMTKSSNTIWTYAWTVPSGSDENGTAAITISATDYAGNSNQDATNSTRTIDNTAPTAVSSLAVSASTTSTITLTWTATGNNGTTGTATGYDIRYSTSTINDGNWATATQATGEPAPSASGSSETMTVSGLSASQSYYFALKASDAALNESALSNVVNGSTQSAGGGGGGGGGAAPATLSGTISINSGAISTNSKSVTLALSASGATQMVVASTSDFAGTSWETYAASKTWTLTDGNGNKSVYAKFRDGSGNFSSVVTDTITLSETSNPTQADPATPADPEQKYPDGTLLQSSSGEAVYVIKDGKKEWIKTAEEFIAGGYKWEDIKVISPEEIAAIADYTPSETTPSKPTDYPDGTLMKIPESFKVYVVISQKKKWIPTPEVFETLGYKWGDVKILSKNELSNITDYEDNLIRMIGDYKVYLVVNGIKRHIPNPEIFLDYGFSWDDIKDVPAATMGKYVNASLVRESMQGNIYYLNAFGVKKWIPTPEVFASYPTNRWEDIQVISKKEMQSYSNANLIRLSGSSEVYLIEGSYKKLVPSETVFNKYKLDWNLVVGVSEIEFNYYKTGSNLK